MLNCDELPPAEPCMSALDQMAFMLENGSPLTADERALWLASRTNDVTGDYYEHISTRTIMQFAEFIGLETAREPGENDDDRMARIVGQFTERQRMFATHCVAASADYLVMKMREAHNDIQHYFDVSPDDLSELVNVRELFWSVGITVTVRFQKLFVIPRSPEVSDKGCQPIPVDSLQDLYDNQAELVKFYGDRHMMKDRKPWDTRIAPATST